MGGEEVAIPGISSQPARPNPKTTFDYPHFRGGKRRKGRGERKFPRCMGAMTHVRDTRPHMQEDDGEEEEDDEEEEEKDEEEEEEEEKEEEGEEKEEEGEEKEDW